MPTVVCGRARCTFNCAIPLENDTVRLCRAPCVTIDTKGRCTAYTRLPDESWRKLLKVADPRQLTLLDAIIKTERKEEQ